MNIDKDVGATIKNSFFNVDDYIVTIHHPYNGLEQISKIDSDGFLYSYSGLYINPNCVRHASKTEIQNFGKILKDHP